MTPPLTPAQRRLVAWCALIGTALGAWCALMDAWVR